MVAQAGAHLHMAAQFLVPPILALVFRPGRDRVVRRGVLLGLLVTYQVFLGEEVLFFLALAAGVLAVAYAVADPALARRLAPALLGRLGVGAAVAGALLAYPLWFQFFGPATTGGCRSTPRATSSTWPRSPPRPGRPCSATSTCRGCWPRTRPRRTRSSARAAGARGGRVVWLWRRPLVRALAVCGALFALLSLGAGYALNGAPTAVPGPYRLVAGLPLLDLAVPARLALVCVPVLGVLVALSLDRIRAVAAPPPVCPCGCCGAGRLSPRCCR